MFSAAAATDTPSTRFIITDLNHSITTIIINTTENPASYNMICVTTWLGTNVAAGTWLGTSVAAGTQVLAWLQNMVRY